MGDFLNIKNSQNYLQKSKNQEQSQRDCTQPPFGRSNQISIEQQNLICESMRHHSLNKMTTQLTQDRLLKFIHQSENENELTATDSDQVDSESVEYIERVLKKNKKVWELYTSGKFDVLSCLEDESKRIILKEKMPNRKLTDTKGYDVTKYWVRANSDSKSKKNEEIMIVICDDSGKILSQKNKSCSSSRGKSSNKVSSKKKKSYDCYEYLEVDGPGTELIAKLIEGKDAESIVQCEIVEEEEEQEEDENVGLNLVGNYFLDLNDQDQNKSIAEEEIAETQYSCEEKEELAEMHHHSECAASRESNLRKKSEELKRQNDRLTETIKALRSSEEKKKKSDSGFKEKTADFDKNSLTSCNLTSCTASTEKSTWSKSRTSSSLVSSKLSLASTNNSEPKTASTTNTTLSSHGKSSSYHDLGAESPNLSSQQGQFKSRKPTPFNHATSLSLPRSELEFGNSKAEPQNSASYSTSSHFKELGVEPNTLSTLKGQVGVEAPVSFKSETVKSSTSSELRKLFYNNSATKTASDMFTALPKTSSYKDLGTESNNLSQQGPTFRRKPTPFNYETSHSLADSKLYEFLLGNYVSKTQLPVPSKSETPNSFESSKLNQILYGNSAPKPVVDVFTSLSKNSYLKEHDIESTTFREQDQINRMKPASYKNEGSYSLGGSKLSDFVTNNYGSRTQLPMSFKSELPSAKLAQYETRKSVSSQNLVGVNSKMTTKLPDALTLGTNSIHYQSKNVDSMRNASRQGSINSGGNLSKYNQARIDETLLNRRVNGILGQSEKKASGQANTFFSKSYSPDGTKKKGLKFLDSLVSYSNNFETDI
ncbi:hypothetical protein BpHYR1_049805 [Brachionus plicatilis]|uniref:Uncharacterized protein n=1 Tax=Brachionus plicatilis TaxID=10195 RepID=A0A3M7RL64_BRAPC|nr:hypothetical protein BpHYR1_049805 [Brachionus plicatilis]